MSTFFNELKSGLEDIVAYKKGKLKLHSEIIEIPEPPATGEASKKLAKLLTD